MNINWHDITKMKYWLARPNSELDKLRKGAGRFWQRVTDMLAWPAAQLDPMTAELELVHLLAWERDITQIPNETEQTYRIRVKYALQFAKGAGSKVGWIEMFEKLGMPWVTIDERLDNVDWDVVSLQILDADLAERDGLIDYICRQYGRTTRRYQYETIAKFEMQNRLTSFDNENDFAVAKANTNLMPLGGFVAFDHHSDFVIAKISTEN
ncbi:MAG: phage tail protein [Pseudoalteromonas distincta]|uniref:phage tail protein n=1 Tax=Pseudoalteromonas distincta TaxID=77608 RepID=UPI003001887A